MSQTHGPEPTQDDIEQLLPWFVTGKLDASEKQMVESYLAAHPAMRSQIVLIEAEQAETTHNNEAVGTPAADMLAKLMARIEGDAASGSPVAALGQLLQRALDWLSDRSALVPVAAAATIALLIQAGAITALVWHGGQPGPSPAAYQTASAPATVAATDQAAYVLAGFTPTATAEQIEKTLQPLGITIADGPKAGGIYRLRLSEKALGDTERDMLMTALKSNSGVVRFVAPAGP